MASSSEADTAQRDQYALSFTSGALLTESAINDLVSYSVSCMFGRYSLDAPGLILADQGSTVQDYLAKVPNPTFPPDRDNVIPIVDGEWFEDDVVERFRQFLRTVLVNYLRFGRALRDIGAEHRPDRPPHPR